MWWLCGLCFLAWPGRGFALELADAFVDRELASGESLVLRGSNRNATRELREPLHAGMRGGRSVWLSWLAPTNGLVTLTTEGSSFDTLLAAYTLEPGDGPLLGRLEAVAENDDEAGSDYTRLQFGVRAGQRYEIAIDGFAGAAGEIQFGLDLLTSAELLPRVLRKPGDRALREGDTLILTIDIQSTEKMEAHWYFNDVKLSDAEGPTLVIPRFQPANVGRYRLRLEVEDFKFFSAPIEIQINSEGITTSLAYNKLEAAVDSAADPQALASAIPPAMVQLADAAASLARGYNGSQIFNTTYATRDPLEPRHCNTTGGASYWFSYRPPDSGELSLDTQGSNYDTLLAVYTFDPPLLSYSELIPVACDDNSGANGLTSRLDFNVSADRTYLIVIDGVNGAKGIARLNYDLKAPTLPSPVPIIIEGPQSQLAAAGATVALQVVAAGRRPLNYQWHHDGAPMPGETNSALTLTALRPTMAGQYSVGVSNQAGEIHSDPAQLDVLTAPAIWIAPGGSTATVAFPAARGFQYQIQTAPDPNATSWLALTNVLTDAGGVVRFKPSRVNLPSQFYRLAKP